VDRYRLHLADLGYVFRPENPERTKRYFREPPGQRRTHLHVRLAGSFGEQFALLFRDFLRDHPDIARHYGERKLALARRYARVEERHAYTEAKSPVIWRIIAQADVWAQRTGWHAGAPDA
jgi:GrpB-like predicted nucleotidyltransferase (UPF0157 family)